MAYRPISRSLARSQAKVRGGAPGLLLLGICALIALRPRPAPGFVVGQAPAPLATHVLFGNARATGSTLMFPGTTGAESRSILLPASEASLGGLPADAVIEKAFLFWSGSLAQSGVSGPTTADPTVSFTAANGATFGVTGSCNTVLHPTLGTTFPPFFYCRADVSPQVALNPAPGGSFNGYYQVGGVAADPAHVDLSGQCTEAPYPACQAKYAAWSLVIIYSAPSETLQRNIHLYDGFLVIDHQDGPGGSPGVTSFVIDGFLADSAPQGTLSFFAVETDAQLGLPPQNLYPAGSPQYCATCQDYLRFNGALLADEKGWPGNLFNESLGGGLGVDLDAIEVGNLIAPGATQATIEIGSGTGPVVNPVPMHGGGELFGLGWTLLSLRRPAPNFKTAGTNKTVNPFAAGQGETVAFTVNVLNAGSLPADATEVVDTLPPLLDYQPGTLQLGGVPCTDAPDGDPCAVTGKVITVSLGIVSHLAPGNARQITFLTAISPSATNGQTLCNQAAVTSLQTPQPHSTTPACLTVQAPQLATPTKTALDLSGGPLAPDDVLQYTVTIPAVGSGPISGISFLDDMPPYLQLLSVIPPPGAQDSSTPNGGANGRGQVSLSAITIPAGASAVTATIIAQVDSVSELAAQGVTPGSIEGLSLCNQGKVTAAFLPADLLTDDPALPGTANATCRTLTYSPALGTSSKTALDVNGGPLEPGDLLRYTLSLVNTGNREATLTVTDDLPPQIAGFTLLGSVPGATFTPPPAGAHGTGQLTVTGLTVPPGQTRTMTFEVTVAAEAPHGAVLQNCMSFAVAEKPSEGGTRCAPALTVTALPDLAGSSKTLLDLNGGPVAPGDALRYTIAVVNSGNRPATAVTVTDTVATTLEAVAPLDGGSYDPATRTLSWSLVSLPPGATASVRFEAAVVVPTPNGTALCNQGSVTSAELPVEPTDDPATPAINDPTCTTVVSQPDLSATTKTVEDLNGAPTRPGDALRYTITVRNEGSATATGLTVRDRVAVHLTAVTPLDGGSWSPATRLITWSVPALAPGQEVTLRFEAQLLSPLPNGLAVANQAFVLGPGLPLPGVPSDDPTTTALDDPTVITVTAAADLGATTKTVVDLNGGVPQPGDTLSYAITVRNTGDAVARSTVVTDVLATSLGGVFPLDGGLFDPASRTITWPAADVVPGTDRVVRFSAGLVVPLPGGTVVCNQASAASPDLPAPTLSDDPATTATDDPTCLTVQSQPDLGPSTKTVLDLNGGQAEPGDTLRYTITVDNVGTQDATAVVVTDVVPLQLTAVVPLDGGVLDPASRTITWSLPVVAAQAKAMVRFEAQVVLPLDNGTTIANQGAITLAELPGAVLTDDPLTPALDDPTVITVSAAADLAGSTKAVNDGNGGKVEPGDLLDYTLTIWNGGNSIARQVVVSDPLDPGLDFVGASAGGSYDPATRTVTWNSATTPTLLELGLGQGSAVTLSLQARVKSPLPDGTQICNQGQLTAAAIAAPQLTDNPQTPVPGDATCLTVASAPDLAGATKTVLDPNGGPLRPGDTLVYTITIPNTGNAPASALVVSDVVDAGLEGVQPGAGGSWNALTRTITWNAATTPALASLSPGASATLTFTALVRKPLDHGTAIANQASLAAAELPTPLVTDDPATIAVDDPTVITVTAAPDLAGSTKTVVDINGGEVEPGDTLTWTITLKNKGDAVAQDVVVTDPVDLSLTGVVPLDGGIYDAASRVITWKVPQVGLSPGGDLKLRFQAKVKAPLPSGTVIANQGSVLLAGSPPALTDDPLTPALADPTVVTVVSKPDLSDLQKTVVGGTPSRRVAPGALLAYTITLPNTGSADALDVLVIDPVDTDLEAVVPLDGGSYDATARQITWKVPVVPVGGSMKLRFSAKVRLDAKNGSTVSNQARVEIAGRRGKILSDDPSTPQQDDPTVLTVEAIPNLGTFTKAVADENGGEVEPGDRLTYTLIVRNSGAVHAFGIRVTDPVQTMDLQDVLVGQGGKLSAGTITWDTTTTPALAQLAPGAAETLTFSARVRVPTANGTVISNQAQLTAEGGTPSLSDDPATPQQGDPTVVKVVSLPRFTRSAKRAIDIDGGLVKPGDIIEYEIKVTNSGTANASGTTLVDAVPTHATYIVNSTSLNGTWVPDRTGPSPCPLAQGLLVASPGQAPGVLLAGEGLAALIRFRVRVRPETQEGTIISNQGMIASAQTAVVPTDDPGTTTPGDPTQVVVGSGPNLSATTKTFAPQPVGDNGNGVFDVGEIVAYQVTIPNHGTARATGVIFTDPLDPAGRSVYQAGSLRLNGQPLSDAADADGGSAAGNKLRVVVGAIDPGQTAMIGYQARVSAGPRVTNQGTVRSTEGQPELTDADGNDANGDSPTVVPVAGGLSRSLRGQKTVQDTSGGDVQAGDELLYTITIFNDSTADEAVDLVDHLPPGTSFQAGSLIVPPGSRPTVEGPPAGQHGRGRLVVSNIAVPQGGSVSLLLRLLLDRDLPEGTAVCNTARLGAGGGLDLQPALEPACVLVGSPAGTGGLAGVVFRDLGEDNRTLDGKDQRLAGFQVQAMPFGNPNGAPAAAAVSDEKGAFRLAALPPGPYALRVLTAGGAQMATDAAVEVPAGQGATQNLPVDPSGVVYESVSGEQLAGVQVFLDYDAEDPLAPRSPVPAALLGAGQQGQVTDATGFYRFDVPSGRRYALRLQPHSPALQFPSALLPAAAGFAVTGPEGEVVPDDLPDPQREGARLLYYLRFRVDGPEDAVFNNHLPVDPLTALIRLEKRADRRRASLGDLVTYTITVENRSTRSFVAPGEQVSIEDVLPRGLRFLHGTSRRIRRPLAGASCLAGESATRDIDGSPACLTLAEPSSVTGQVLRFGPFPLGAGESLRQVYRLAVGLDTRQGIYRNRAVLRDGGLGVALSNTAEAALLVEPDPDLDQGLLLGKVFCDADGDGRQGRGERGLAGVRVYLDSGSYAVTDETGKYHLRDIDPGLHLLKLDVNTLPAGSRLTTDAARVIQFTRGLPAKVGFGATCRENWVGVQRIALKPHPGRPASPGQRPAVVPTLGLTGDARALRVALAGRVLPTPEADLALQPAGGEHLLGGDWDRSAIPRLRRDIRGRLSPRLVFNLRSRGGARRGWRLSVWRWQGGERQVVRRFSGTGQPPAQLLWDGQGASGKAAADTRAAASEPPTLYQAQLEVLTFDGKGATSPRRAFAVNWGRRPLPEADPPGPSAQLDGVPLALDPRSPGGSRFTTTLGRVGARPPLLELRRGDGKTIWLHLGAIPSSEEEPPERVKVEGNLETARLLVDGRPVDSSLLRIGLALADPTGTLPPLTRDGRLTRAVELTPSFTTPHVRRWILRLGDPTGRRQRRLGGVGPVPLPLTWDGLTDEGQPLLQPGGTCLARLTLEDAAGNVGHSPIIQLRAPPAVSFTSLKLQGPRLFQPEKGILVGVHHRRLLATLRLLQRRPPEERYRLTVRVAPPVIWESGRWAGLIRAVQGELERLLQQHGLSPVRFELTVGALPLPSVPVVPKGKRGRAPRIVRAESLYLDPVPPPPVTAASEPPRVLVDGEALTPGKDGGFATWARVQLGAALVLDLRDGSGRRALLLVPTRTRGKPPGSSSRALPSARVAAWSAPSAPASAPHSAPGSVTEQRAVGAPAASRPFGAEELRRAFGLPRSPAPPPPPDPAKVPAARLEVDLPPAGAVLKSHELALRGRTHPENRVTVNGKPVQLRADGSFSHLVQLPDGKSELLIRSRDHQGNQGTIRWPVAVSDRALFVMAMAEGAIGQVGAELDGSTDHTRIAAGPVMLHGRAALYLKGRIKGRRLFKQYFVTAHVDTAKQREFEEFFDQVIDPNRYYPIYGDSAREVRDVNARDKYYLLVEADRSSLLVGNFTAGVKGIELLRYDRMLYGVRAHLDQPFLGGKLRQEARAFVSNDDARLARDHNVLRATGGSIYYLRHGEVLEGSERVNLVVRERDTGLLLATVPQSRDQDYVIDYGGGRLLFKAPVSSVADAGFGVSNPAFTLSTMAGHPVYLEIDYEYERTGEEGGRSFGFQARSTLFDVLTVGASYVQEGRAAEQGASYRLYGAELTLRRGTGSAITAEFARSSSFDAQNFLSEDGGITYLGLNHIAALSADARASDSNAYKVTAVAELSDFIKRLKPETLKLQGYFSRLDRGFFSDGTILEQGRTKYGGSAAWRISERDRLTLRHDGAIALLPQIPLPATSLDPLALREIETELTRLRYELRRGRLDLQGEYAHGYLRDPLAAGFDSHRDSLALQGSYRLGKRLRLRLGQDILIHASANDPQLDLGALSPSSTGAWEDRLVTTVGAALAVTKELEVELAESVRWSGDNATSAGLRIKMSPTASIYARQILTSLDRGLTTTSVAGAEDRFGPRQGGRTYGEYQLESGVSGTLNRAILGLDHKWAPWHGIGFSGGYEHQQVFGGHLPDGTPMGDNQRDVFHLGFELTRLRRLKLSTRAELRYDNGGGVLGLSPGGVLQAANVDTRPGLGQGTYGDRLVTPGSQLLLTPGERLQVVSRTAVSLAATRDLTLMGRANFYHTYNRTEARVEAQALELGVGAALRPVAWDWLTVLLKYTRLLEQRPLSLSGGLASSRSTDVASLVPILELPFRLQLVEKLAYKRVAEESDLLPGSRLATTIHTLLWINRLNFHLTGRLDAGVEYRFLRLFLPDQGDQLKHGALFELGYWVHEYVRLGAGYNFSTFSDNEFADQDRDAAGVFFRVVGKY